MLCYDRIDVSERVDVNKTSGNISLMAWGVVIRIRRFLVQNPLGAQFGLGTQPRYETPGEVYYQLLILGYWGCPLKNDPKLTVHQSNSS